MLPGLVNGMQKMEKTEMVLEKIEFNSLSTSLLIEMAILQLEL